MWSRVEFLWPVPVTIMQEWGLNDTIGTDKLSCFSEPAAFHLSVKSMFSGTLSKTCLVSLTRGTQAQPESKKIL